MDDTGDGDTGPMNEHFSWLVAAMILTTINTGGGSSVDGDVTVGNDVAMRDIIHADQYTWRSHVDHRLRDYRDEMRSDIMELRRNQNYQWVMLAIVAVLFLFSLTISAGVVIRQFDILSVQMEMRFDRIDRRMDGARLP
jgi:hypothetical protein